MSDDEINQLHINQKEEKPSIVDILTFEHLAELAKQQGAARYIAAVSGDVDNMGHLFEHLMEREKAPLTMAVTISRQFDFFFSGILDAHLRNGDKRIYTVYAGGDDLFYIGAWNEILDEVYEWRKLFGAYVANHPKITFSAGVSLHHPNLPINRIRHDAEEQLKQAKNANKEDPTDKNRICIWNTPLKWSDKEKDEWNNEVIMYVNLLNEAINKKALNSSMMYRLLSYTRSAKKVHSKSKKMRIDDCIWNSLLRYDIARNWKDKNNNKQFKNGLEKIGKEVEQFYGVGTVDPVKYDLFGNKFPIALMWALYLVRHKESKPKNKGE
ncbi:MAG: hypothetical protein N2450_00375, partial [bacterium]|nr:hypothetical protein [bacterium]